MQITSFLVSNLHCESCAFNIENALYALKPRPISVTCSIIASWVTVQHELSLSASTIRDALEDVGFDVRGIFTGDPGQEAPTPDQEISYKRMGFVAETDRAAGRRMSGLLFTSNNKRYIRIKEKHLETCDLCRADHSTEEKEKQPIVEQKRAENRTRPKDTIQPDAERTRAVDSRNTPPIERNTAVPRVAGTDGPDMRLLVLTDVVSEDLWRGTFAVGGMTCASCVNSIKEELEMKDWIQKVDINLLVNSATIEFAGELRVNEIREMIENLGYEAEVDHVVRLKDPKDKSTHKRTSNMEGASQLNPRRVVEIKVDGMFCPLCPERVLGSLASFGYGAIRIEQALTLKNPIVKISYIPSAPDFTIRQVMVALSNIDQNFKLSIYHPPTLEERSRLIHDRERRSILIRIALCVLIAIPAFIVGIVFMSLVPPLDGTRQFLESNLTPGVSRIQWALFILATPVYFFAADRFHLKTLKEIRSAWRRGSKTPMLKRFYRFGSMDMLISLGTSIAYFSSVAQIISFSANPAGNISSGSFYFDSVVFLTMFLLIGRFIEAYSKSKTGDAVAMLGKLRPTTATLVDDRKYTEQTIGIDLIDFGDIVRVTQGASPPSDGIVTKGDANFDESSLTGESKLVRKYPGDQVFSGTVNKGGPISIAVTGVAGTSMIDRIIEAVREGQTRHAAIEKLADTLTGHFVPLITLIAICTWLIWLCLGLSGALPSSYLDVSSGGWPAWSLQFAIAVFVVACPCGLGLAAPTAIFVGGGLAAKYGILVKGGGEAFEKASQLNCVVFDKTGTLTVGGEPTVTESGVLFRGNPVHAPQAEKEIFGMIKRLEENSSHPIAKAIVSFCNSKDLENGETHAVTEVAGKGMKGVFVSASTGDESEIIAGNERLMNEYNIEITSDVSEILGWWKNQAKSVALVAKKSIAKGDQWQLCAIFGISDEIRPEASEITKALQERGIDVWMLSGDNYGSACAIGAQVGIPKENIIAGVLPSQKAEQIQYLQRSLKARNSQGEELTQQRALVAMVGDGINDSPALTAADVGIAIGSGSDIAISSAEFVLVTSNLNSLITLLDLSRTVFNRIKFNFGWALVYNLIGVPVAAGVFYPVVSNGNHVRLDPVWASLAMALSSISVVCSSLALRSGIPGVGFRNHRSG